MTIHEKGTTTKEKGEKGKSGTSIYMNNVDGEARREKQMCIERLKPRFEIVPVCV